MLMYEQQLALDHVYFLDSNNTEEQKFKKRFDSNNIEEQKLKKRFGSKAMTLTVGGTGKKKSYVFLPLLPGKQSKTENI